MKTFKRFLNEVKTLKDEDSDIILNLFKSFEYQNVKLSVINVGRKNITFKINYQIDRRERVSGGTTKKHIISGVIENKLTRMGLLVSFDAKDVKIKKPVCDVDFLVGVYGTSLHKGWNVSAEITTTKDNLLTPKSIKQINRIVDKKMKKIKSLKEDPKTLLYIMQKLSPDLKNYKIHVSKPIKPDNKGIKVSGAEVVNKKAFRISYDNEFVYDDLPWYKPVGIVLLNYKYSPFERALVERLYHYFHENFTIKNTSVRPDVTTYNYKHKHNIWIEIN